jgi:hypothetical protein
MEDTQAATVAADSSPESNAAPADASLLDSRDVSESPVEQNLNFVPEWLQQLPDDLREITEKYKDPIQLLKAYKASNDALSKRVEQFTENEWNAFRASNDKAFGVPETSEKYELKFAKFQEDSSDILDDNSKDVLKKTFHALGLNNDQANYIYNLFNETHFRSEKIRDDERAIEAKNTEEFLKNEWGKGFEENLNYAKICLDSVVPQALNETPEDIKKWFLEKGYHNDQRLLRLVSMMGRLNSNTPRTPSGNITKTDAAVLYNQRIRDAEYMKAFNSLNHPDHERTVAELTALAKKAMR